MQPHTKETILNNRNRLRLGAKQLFTSLNSQQLHKVGLFSPAEKNTQEAVITNQQPKSTNRKRKVSEDMSVFESRHKTREVNISANFQDLFEVLEKLGEGAQSTVKRCREKATGNIYAVKVFRSDSELIDNLKIQYKILKTLCNEFIIDSHYLFVNPKENASHMVLQYCDFQSLRECLIEQLILSEDETSSIVNKLLLALTYMHGKGICHRDIKPENILYDRATGNIKLIDFEIAKTCKNKYLRLDMWTKTGTVQYCAPEMFLGGYTELVDIWAVGVLTYQMICGKYPFKIEYVKDAPGVFETEPQFPESMSSFAKDFIKRCLTSVPCKRASAKDCLTSPFLLVGSNHSPTPPSDKLNHSFDDASTWSNTESFKESMRCVEEEEAEEFLGDDIGIRCFSDYFE